MDENVTTDNNQRGQAFQQQPESHAAGAGGISGLPADAESVLVDRRNKHTHIIQLLKKSRSEFLMVFDSVPAMIWYRDRTGKILRVNQCAADSVNQGVRDLVGKNYYTLFPDGADRSRQQDLQVIQSGRPLRGQTRQFQAFDGTPRWALVDRIPLRDKQEGRIVGVMVFAQDITEQKKAEDQLVRAKKEIEIRNEQLKAAVEKANRLAAQADRSNRIKSEVLASSSHDLRTPMNAIIGFSELLKDTHLDPEQTDYVQTINKAATGLLALINDILDYTKLDAGKLHIDIVACSIAEAVQEIESIIAPGARQKGLSFLVEIDPTLPESLFVDPMRLKQCLLNLTGNAVKFTRAGHVALRVRRRDHAGREGICFDVEDTGIGIAKDRQAAIFKAYSQADKTTERVYGGTGLGLTITRKLAELLGGHVSVTSEPGKGSVFSLVLPLLADAARFSSQLKEPAVCRRPDDGKGAQGRILIAEGNVPSQLAMNLLLRRVGLAVETAADAEALFAALEASAFDIILLDLAFERNRGLDLVRRIRRSGIETPVIAIADCDLKWSKEALAAGCQKYLTKPVFRRELYEAIEEVQAEMEFEMRLRSPDTEAAADAGSEADAAIRWQKFSEIVDGTVNPEELTRLLPDLFDQLRAAFDHAAAQEAADVLNVLCRIGRAGGQTEFVDRVNALRDHDLTGAEALETSKEMIDQLERICRDGSFSGPPAS